MLRSIAKSGPLLDNAMPPHDFTASNGHSEGYVKRSGNLSTPDAVTMLMRRIEGGRFRPGERIFPKDIAQEMGGSAIPVREALCQLVGRGIVVEQRNKGFRIAPMTSATLCSLYTAHARLMGTAVEGWDKGASLPGYLRNPWRTFAAIAYQADSEVLAGMQHYLAGRLAIARKFEKACFTAKGIDYTVVGVRRPADPETAAVAIREFHWECERSSADIWRLLSDR